MKRRLLLWVIVALCLCAAGALSEEETKTFDLRFDEGFTLSLPEGWVSYPPGEGPMRYILGAGDGARYLYILIQSAPVEDFEAMRAAIEANADCGRTSPLDLNGRTFAAFIAPRLNASGCATLADGKVVTFLFAPQDDSDFMLTAAGIMGSIKF
jgi:hypothetical protein